MIYPPLSSNFVVPDLPLMGDRGEQTMLHALLKKDASITLFIPGFMSCHGVCPRLAQLYKEVLKNAALQSADVQVVFFSFDPDDTAITLQKFREMQGLLENWLVTHSNPASTQALLSSLKYTIMKQDFGYQHPAQAFVFTSDLTWAGSLYGTDVDAKELTELYDQVRFKHEHPVASATLAFIKNPDTIAVGAGAGLLIGLALITMLAIRTKRYAKSEEAGIN